MKKKLLIAMIALNLIIILTNSVLAQSTASMPVIPVSLSIGGEGVISNNHIPVRANVKAVRHFNKRYNGQAARWYESQNELIAKFSADSIRTVVGYAKQGRWLYTIKHYGESQMPVDLRHIIRSEYYDFQIQLINEVVVPQHKGEIYLVHLVNRDGEHRIIRYSGEGLEIVRQFSEYRSTELAAVQPCTSPITAGN